MPEDENPDDAVNDHTVSEDTERDDDANTSAEDDSDAPSTSSTDPDEAKGSDQIASFRTTLADLNRSIIGTLVLHYASRDVVLPFDGFHALDVIATYRDRRPDTNGFGLGSLATCGWLAFRLGDVLAVSWCPTTDDTIVVDPVH